MGSGYSSTDSGRAECRNRAPPFHCGLRKLPLPAAFVSGSDTGLNDGTRFGLVTKRSFRSLRGRSRLSTSAPYLDAELSHSSTLQKTRGIIARLCWRGCFGADNAAGCRSLAGVRGPKSLVREMFSRCQDCIAKKRRPESLLHFLQTAVKL